MSSRLKLIYTCCKCGKTFHPWKTKQVCCDHKCNNLQRKGMSEQEFRLWLDEKRAERESNKNNVDIEINDTPDETDSEDADPNEFKQNIEYKRLQDEIKRHKKRIKEPEHKELGEHKLVELIHDKDYEELGLRTPPEWVKLYDPKKKTSGTAILGLSDWHYSEIIDPSQINYVNSYNIDIADKRMDNVASRFKSTYIDKTLNPNYEGLILALLGDMLSGNIHEEFEKTNEVPILVAMLRAEKKLIEVISYLHEHFGRMYIVCVVGNHGRLYRKPHAKNKIYENFEWMIYQHVMRYFVDNPDIVFNIPASPEYIIDHYGMRILCTHGDQFRGGSGISGFYTPLSLGHSRKTMKLNALGTNFDVMLCAHFHQYIVSSKFIVNGSICGYNEYADQRNFTFERPKQLGCIIHKQHGMVGHTPILADDVDENTKDNGVFDKYL